MALTVRGFPEWEAAWEGGVWPKGEKYCKTQANT